MKTKTKQFPMPQGTPEDPKKPAPLKKRTRAALLLLCCVLFYCYGRYGMLIYKPLHSPVILNQNDIIIKTDNLKMVKLVSVYNMYADRKLFLPYLVKDFILQIAACISHFAPPVSKNAPLSPCPVPPRSRIPLHRTNVCVPPCGTM